MKPEAQKTWRRYWPSHVNNPFRLAWRLLGEENPAARSALMMAAAGFALVPFDLILSVFERKTVAVAPRPDKPIVLVCGPPRSGTTLVAEYLINTLRVGYLNNLTSLFPRSPLTANALFGRWMKPGAVEFRAYYGKTRGLSGVNDALYIWDRWLGADRAATPDELSAWAQQDMLRFFGALQRRHGLPIVNKVNRLNTCTHLVAEALPSSIFIYLRRDPLMLAQSLYIARRDIVGDLSKPYGVSHPNRVLSDSIEDVCRQVDYYDHMLQLQLGRVGKERLIVLDYEDFCAKPNDLISRLTQHSSTFEQRDSAIQSAESFSVSRKVRLEDSILQRFEERLGVSYEPACVAR